MIACLRPLRGKGPMAYAITPGPLRSPCWVWQGSLNSKGYALRGTAAAGVFLVHRLVDEAVNGPLPVGLQVHHRCEVRACVRPEHLDRVTPLEHAGRHAVGETAGEAAVRVVAEFGPMTRRQIAVAADRRLDSISVTLTRAVARGDLVRLARGWYGLPAHAARVAA